METSIKYIRRKYLAPLVEVVILDAEISLALESAPPIGPDELGLDNQNPFKNETRLV